MGATIFFQLVSARYFYLGRELGFYREQGLDGQIEDVARRSKALQAMFGGSVDVCACVYELAIQLNSEGRHVQSFLTMLERPGLALAVSPSSSRALDRAGSHWVIRTISAVENR